MVWFSYFILLLIIFLSETIIRKYKWNHYFISIPWIALLFLLVGDFFTDSYFFQFHPSINRIILNTFLFTIGIQSGLIFTTNYWRRIFKFLGWTTFGLVSLTLFSRTLQDESFTYIIGTTYAAFNQELMEKIVPAHDQFFVEYWSSIQLVLLFILTPLFLNFIYIWVRKINDVEQKEFFEDPKLKWSLSRMGLLALSVSSASVILNEHVLQGSIPFLFDYVFTAFVGYAIGKSHVALSNRSFPYLEDMNNLGNLSLYAFICVTIYEAAQVGFDSFRPIFFVLILTKTLVIGVMIIGIVLVALKKMKKEEKMISIVAGWTLLLNAPVTCMHGMRSVTSKLGPVPQVLLIVPPVVLWLINYVQWGIHSFL